MAAERKKNKANVKEHYQIISIRVLADRSAIDYQKVYNTLALKEPLYNSMDANDKANLANALFKDVSKIFKDLGVEISMKRK